MLDRRRLLAGSFSTVVAARVRAASTLPETDDIDQLGTFELVLGRPGVVVGVPHATPDTARWTSGESFASASAPVASSSPASGTQRRAGG